jgi:prophage regulatory protein
MQSERLLRAQEVCARTGLSRTSIWRLIKKADFPSPVVLTRQRVGWREAEVDQWIATRSVAPGYNRQVEGPTGIGPGAASADGASPRVLPSFARQGGRQR